MVETKGLVLAPQDERRNGTAIGETRGELFLQGVNRRGKLRICVPKSGAIPSRQCAHVISGRNGVAERLDALRISNPVADLRAGFRPEFLAPSPGYPAEGLDPSVPGLDP
jgi:hypothetical protein